jgi:DNA-binding CsgD family transcriptional regulator
MKSQILIPREGAVLKLVCEGLLNKQIAGKLGICEGTVKRHRARGMRKLGITSVAQLVRIADRINISQNCETSVLSTLETTRRLLLALSEVKPRGADHVRAAIRQIAKAIEENKPRGYVVTRDALQLPPAVSSHE